MKISEKIKELCEKALKIEYTDPLESSSFGCSISIGIVPSIDKVDNSHIFSI